MQKRIPMRQCLGCREMKPKKELLRAVKSPTGEVSLDNTGKKPGRGAYVCNNPDCINRITKSKAFSRAFKTQTPDSMMEELSLHASTCDQ